MTCRLLPKIWFSESSSAFEYHEGATLRGSLIGVPRPEHERLRRVASPRKLQTSDYPLRVIAAMGNQCHNLCNASCSLPDTNCRWWHHSRRTRRAGRLRGPLHTPVRVEIAPTLASLRGGGAKSTRPAKVIGLPGVSRRSRQEDAGLRRVRRCRTRTRSSGTSGPTRWAQRG